jgi:CAAX prenyl protease-like protein
MNFTRVPIAARVFPFILFLALTSLQGKFGLGSHFWVYGTKTIIGAGLVLAMRPFVKEMRWAFSWEAVVVGIFVFVMWVGINPFYPKWGRDQIVWNAPAYFGQGSRLAWGFIVLRILGSGLVVPPMEEVFYRSFVYRYAIKPEPSFVEVPFSRFDLRAFMFTSVLFGLAHGEWLAGILCGAIYQWLVIRKNRLGDAMTAHAITNILLGIWIVWKGAWQFW